MRWISTLALLLVHGLTAGLPAQSQPSHRFEHLQVPGGMNENFGASIAQDSLGFIWLGSWGGLHRYDGYAFTTYAHDPTDSTSLSANWVESLYVDRAGTLWAGTYGGGLNRLDPDTGTFAHYRHDPDDSTSLSQDSVTVILEDRTGTLWVGTHGGLNRLNRETGAVTRYQYDPDDATTLGNDQVRALYEDAYGILWVGTNSPFAGERANPGPGGLNRFDPATETFRRYLHDPDDPRSLISNHVMSLFEDSRGTFWVGTMGGVLHRMDRQAGTFERFVYDPRRLRRLSGTERTSLSPSCNAVSCGGITFVDEDRDGSLWIGAFGQGILRYDPESEDVTHFEHESEDPSSLSNNFVWTMVESRDGTRWIGETVGGFDKMRLAGSPFEHYTLSPALDADWIMALHADPAGRLWIGMLGSLVTLTRRSGGASSYEVLQLRSYPEVSLAAIEQTQDATLWIGTYEGTIAARQGGLYEVDPETGIRRPVLSDSTRFGERVGPVVAIHEDDEGGLWLGTRWTGLYRMNRATGEVTHYAPDPDDPTSLSHANVTTLYEAPSEPGVLWVGTEGGGLNRFDQRTEIFTTYQHDPQDPVSLGGGHVTSIVEDARGRLWVGTRSGGLNQFDRRNEAFRRFNAYNSALPDNHVACVLGDSVGDLWIGTGRGLTHFDPDVGFFYTYGPEHGVKAAPFMAAVCDRGPAGELVFGGTNGFVAFRPDEVRAQGAPPTVALTGFLLAEQPVGPDANGPLRKPIWKTDAIRLAHDEHTFAIEFAAFDYRDPEVNQYVYMLEGYDETWREAGTQRRASYARVPPGAYTFRVLAANSAGVWNEEGAALKLTITRPWWRANWAYVFYGLLFLTGVFAVDRIQRRRVLRRERERARKRMLERERDHAREIEAANARLRAHEQQLEEQNAKLAEQARRLAELDELKSRFFANISHEFRTPLTLILGPIKDALGGRYGKIDGRFQAQLVLMRQSAQRLLELIGQLLDLSRLDAGAVRLQARRIDVVPLLRRLVQSFSGHAEREAITLQFEAKPDAITLHVDRDKFEKVVVNLLSNAFKFTPSGGKIRVEAEAARHAGQAVAQIAVRDTGQGIPEEERLRIFDRFYQVDASATRRHEGTGIGLALVKELVERHGGLVDVESTVGFGTTVTVRLLLGTAHLRPEDLVEEDVSTTEPQSSVDIPAGVALEEEGAAGGETLTPAEALDSDGVEESRADRPLVLVVEDHADVRAYLRGHLAARYEVIEAADGAEGLAQARRQRPDLVIADVMMPEMDGFELCRRLKTDEELRQIPVLLLTARADEESRLEGLEIGADAYLTKPFSAEELLVRAENLTEVRRMLRRRFSEEVVIGPSAVVATSRDAALVERIRTVVEANMAETDLTVAWLADEVGLSTRQLHRKMLELAKLTPAAYIRMMRMERAAQLLQQDAGNVSEVAYAVGYRDASYFSRLFKQAFGVAPSAFAADSE